MMLVLMIVAVVVAMAATAGPAMAQTAENKAAAKAAKKAERQAAKKAARKAERQAAKKALPATGGIPASAVALLGTGALIVGGGLVVHRAVRR
jgi:LPXTG-motif cell wall-anchored protein